MSESFDQLYGKKGIDTSYERETFTYRPTWKYEKKDLDQLLREEIKQSIERARTFTIAQNLLEYDELIADIGQMLRDLESRNPKEKIEKLKEHLSQKDYRALFAFEREHSSYQDTGDYELYSLLFHMKESLQVRRDFIDRHFRTQITHETEIKKIEEAERKSIEEWEYLEAKVMEGYALLAQQDEDEIHPADDTSLFINTHELNYEILEDWEKQKRNRELLHTSLADSSYVHRNRYFMFLEIVEKAKILVYYPTQLIDKNLKEFILSLGDLSDFSSPKTHLILQFRKIRERHDSLKGKMMTIDDEKETFASEKHYLYQQIETKTIEPLKQWLHEQQENISGALDLFSQYMVSSMKETRQSYEQILADLLNFYKSEAHYYEQQIYFLRKKEEIRKFYRILEDLEDVEKIHKEWVEEYLKVNGYSV